VDSKQFTTPPVPAGRRKFPPLAKAQVVELACLEPSALNLHLTQWSVRTLSQVVVENGILESVHYSTIHLILDSVDLQPHRNKYWKTSELDSTFKERAEQILWCYESVDRLVAEGYWVVCVDEKPNIQALERQQPSRPARPGLVRRTEFEYIRHGTVNMLFYLFVHDGQMVGQCLPHNDAEHYIESLECLRSAYRKKVKGVYLIQDNGSSHVAEATQDYFAEDPDWWRPRYTPPHASWLNQAELLIGAFSKRYLRGGSWNSEEALIEHLNASWPEYNQRFAHPFEWTWNRSKMRNWFHDHASRN
jgi:transposase